MTHDLMCQLIEALGAKIVRVLVTELREGTFYAQLHLLEGERNLVLSCRPSDAIALAARTHSPLYVEDALMDDEGLVIEPDEDDVTVEANPDEVVGEFREFLERIRPEDFTS
jgi:hypothetical protein